MSKHIEAKSDAARFGGAKPIFRINDLKASIEYYVTVLGFKIDWQAPGGITAVSRGRCAIFLVEGDQGNPGGWVWAGVGDAQVVFEEYLATGARIRHPPTNYFWALELQVEDPDGNVLRLGSDPNEGEPFGEWRDMRGDFWLAKTEGGWTKIVAEEGASYFIDQARFARAEARPKEVRRCLFVAVGLLREHGTKADLARALRDLGEVERGWHSFAAQKHYDEAIALYRELNEGWPLAHALGHLGMLHHDLGRPDDARAAYEEALRICRTIPDLNRLDLANTINRLARFEDEMGFSDEAAPLLVAAHGHYLATGIQAGVADTAARLSGLYHRQGEVEKSREWFAKATAAAEQANDPNIQRMIETVRQQIGGVGSEKLDGK